jgi:hypothetical protein
MGATPQSLAKAASERSLSGLSPRQTSRAAVVSPGGMDSGRLARLAGFIRAVRQGALKMDRKLVTLAPAADVRPVLGFSDRYRHIADARLAERKRNRLPHDLLLCLASRKCRLAATSPATPTPCRRENVGTGRGDPPARTGRPAAPGSKTTGPTDPWLWRISSRVAPDG